METIKKVKLLIMVTAMSTLVNCTNKEKEEPTTVTTTTVAAPDKLAVVAPKDSMEDIFRQTLTEINDNLNSIRVKEGLLAVNTSKYGDKVFSKREEILNNIAVINTLLEQNRNKIHSLNKQVASYSGAKKRWKKEILDMAEIIKQKESDIADLSEQLTQQLSLAEERNNKIKELEASNQIANTTTATMDKEMHKAYYTLGTYKELKKHHVVEKEGGILGIGSTQTLDPAFDSSYFTVVDTRQATGIVINGKKAKLVTHHPVGSYELKKEGEETAYLTIKDPDKFWGASKYLVVEVK